MFLPFDIYRQYEFHLIGISHKTAPVEIREAFYIDEKEKQKFFHEAKKMRIDNLLLLSTCNRTELYAFTQHPEALKKIWQQNFKSAKHIFSAESIYHYSNHRAIKHLFEVTCGLDAQILGDFEIIGQVKKALETSKENQCINKYLLRTVEYAIAAAKKSKKETLISNGASSVASAAVGYLQKNIPKLSEKKIALIGAGKIGKKACENLLKKVKPENITIVNRTKSKAKTIANRYHIHYDSIENLKKILHDNDIILVATNANRPIITKEHIQIPVVKPKMLLDLSVPRNVYAEVGLMPNISVINIEHLEDLKNESLKKRIQSIPKVKQIIHAQQLELYSWMYSAIAAPLVEKIIQNRTKADIQAIALMLKEANWLNEAMPVGEEKILNHWINYVKQNHHKTSVKNWCEEVFC